MQSETSKVVRELWSQYKESKEEQFDIFRVSIPAGLYEGPEQSKNANSELLERSNVVNGL